MYHIKINKFSSQKRPLREWKCQRQSRERYLQLPVLHKRLVSGRCKQLPQINKTETNNLRERLVKEKRKKKKTDHEYFWNSPESYGCSQWKKNVPNT